MTGNYNIIIYHQSITNYLTSQEIGRYDLISAPIGWNWKIAHIKEKTTNNYEILRARILKIINGKRFDHYIKPYEIALKDYFGENQHGYLMFNKDKMKITKYD